MHRLQYAVLHLVFIGLLTQHQHAALAVSQHALLPTCWSPMTAEAPVIDGDLSDAAWVNAVNLGPFVTMTGEEVKDKGTGKVTWDAQNLYIAFDLQQPGADQLPPTGMKRDGDIYTKDCVEIFIAAKLDFRTYFHFLVNAENVQRDEKCDLAATPMLDTKWDATWQSATKRTRDGWTVEIAIPLSVLGLNSATENVIGLNLCRNDTQSGQLSCWSPTGSGFHVPSQFGLMALVKEPHRPAVDVSVTDVGQLMPGATLGKAIVQNRSDGELSLDVEATVGSDKELWKRHDRISRLAPEGSDTHALGYKVKESGAHGLGLVVRDSRSHKLLSIAGMAFSVPIAFNQKFGYRLPSAKGLDLWWAENTYKIMKETPAPERRSREVTLSAARREWEPVQLVLRSPQGLKDVTVSVSDFRRGKSMIPSSTFQVMKVEYVPIQTPTDAFGSVDDYPDPLPPLKGPFDVHANENTPLWILAHVPADALAGDYVGRVTIEASDHAPIDIPVRLHVFDFALTEETHTRTAYGLGLETGFLGLKDPTDQESVWEKYLACFRDHRLSPYSPMARHPMKYAIHGPQWRFTNGPLELVCDRFSNNYFSMSWSGKPLATLTNTMTQFEKEGVGWKGTGVGWPGISNLKEVRVIDRNSKRWILEVTGENAGSSPANRRYEITFQLYVPAGQPWFATRMVHFKNSDATRYQMQGYFYILNTALDKREVVKGNGYALYLGEGHAVGAISAEANMQFDPSPIYIQKSLWLDPGQETDGYGPTMVFFTGEANNADEAKSLVEKIRSAWGQQDPSAWIPAGDAQLAVEEKKEITVTHDYADFDNAAAKYLDEWKFNGFNFADFGAVPDSLGPYHKDTPEYDRLHALVYGEAVQHLREKGWLDKAYCYWFDEPSEEQYDTVNEGMDILKRSCPGLMRLITKHVAKKMIGHVDLWVPVLSDYDPKTHQPRQKAGEHVWWYVCCGPRAPYPNDFIDHPAINHRIRYWMMEKYGVEGDLYWATTWYYGAGNTIRSPWESGMSLSPDGGTFGNGDGMLLYPACRKPSDTPVLDGPVVSQRIELIREGLEDLEYFWTLERLMQQLESRLSKLPTNKQAEAQRLLVRARDALRAPDRLAKSLTEYTKDPQDLFRERKKIAEKIEAMQRL